MNSSTFSAIAVLALLGGCSSAGWNGYGPKGEGLIGSAYGYEDVKIDETTFFVSYTGGTVPEAVQGFHRRAKELCLEIGRDTYEIGHSPGTVSGQEGTSMQAPIFGALAGFSSSLPQQNGYVNCK